MGKNVAIKDGKSIRVSKDKFITETEFKKLFSQLGLDIDLDSLYKTNPYASYDFSGINIHIQNKDIHFTEEDMMNFLSATVLTERITPFISENGERYTVDLSENEVV